MGLFVRRDGGLPKATSRLKARRGNGVFLRSQKALSGVGPGGAVEETPPFKDKGTVQPLPLWLWKKGEQSLQRRVHGTAGGEEKGSGYTPDDQAAVPTAPTAFQGSQEACPAPPTLPVPAHPPGQLRASLELPSPVAPSQSSSYPGSPSFVASTQVAQWWDSQDGLGGGADRCHALHLLQDPPDLLVESHRDSVEGPIQPPSP